MKGKKNKRGEWWNSTDKITANDEVQPSKGMHVTDSQHNTATDTWRKKGSTRCPPPPLSTSTPHHGPRSTVLLYPRHTCSSVLIECDSTFCCQKRLGPEFGGVEALIRVCSMVFFGGGDVVLASMLVLKHSHQLHNSVQPHWWHHEHTRWIHWMVWKNRII